MAGAGKSRNQDALFNGHEVLQATSVAPQDVPATVPLRLAVADGVYASPGAHLSPAATGCTLLPHKAKLTRVFCAAIMPISVKHLPAVILARQVRSPQSALMATARGK